MRIPTRVNLAGEALFRRYLAKPDLTGLDAWVVSPGGVGTTFLMEYLSSFLRLNHPYDDDGLKHWRAPPRHIEKLPIKVIFISGNVDDIVSSIARRDWIATQSVKLGSAAGVLLQGKNQRSAFRKAVIEQQRAWAELDDNRILTLEYEEIWDSVPKIARYLSLEAEPFIRGFPERVNRTSQRDMPSLPKKTGGVARET